MFSVRNDDAIASDLGCFIIGVWGSIYVMYVIYRATGVRRLKHSEFKLNSGEGVGGIHVSICNPVVKVCMTLCLILLIFGKS
jgi:hypothetical protein